MTGAGWTSFGTSFREDETVDKIDEPRRRSPNLSRAARIRYLVKLGLAVEDGFRDAGVDMREAFDAPTQRDLMDDTGSDRTPRRVAVWVRGAAERAAVREFVE